MAKSDHPATEPDDKDRSPSNQRPNQKQNGPIVDSAQPTGTRLPLKISISKRLHEGLAWTPDKRAKRSKQGHEETAHNGSIAPVRERRRSLSIASLEVDDTAHATYLAESGTDGAPLLANPTPQITSPPTRPRSGQHSQIAPAPEQLTTTIMLDKLLESTTQVGRLTYNLNQLENKNSEHLSDIARLTLENASLRTERDQWRFRAEHSHQEPQQSLADDTVSASDEDDEMSEVDGALQDPIAIELENLRSKVATLEIRLETAQTEVQAKANALTTLKSNLDAALLALVDCNNLLDADIKVIESFQETWDARIKTLMDAADEMPNPESLREEMLLRVNRLRSVHKILR